LEVKVATVPVLIQAAGVIADYNNVVDLASSRRQLDCRWLVG
jgi:hypothetical protein